jgi:hypothetical protein
MEEIEKCYSVFRTPHETNYNYCNSFSLFNGARDVPFELISFDTSEPPQLRTGAMLSVIIIISLFMSPLLGHRLSLWITSDRHYTNHIKDGSDI